MRRVVGAGVLLLSASAWAGRPAEITVTVVLPSGEPATQGIVVFPGERERHLVNSEVGTWKGDVLYLPDGSERWFEKGTVEVVRASAPGYAVRATEVAMEKRRTSATVTLEPLPALELSCAEIEAVQGNGTVLSEWARDALKSGEERTAGQALCLYRARVAGAMLQWRERRDAYDAEPTSDAMAGAVAAREASRTLAGEWLAAARAEGGDVGAAEAWCQAADALLAPCD